jgi:chromosomal replication initiation ATPase DnaA
MNRQIPLPIAQRHRYDPKSFFIHNGVDEAAQMFAGALSSQDFSGNILLGSARTGKTHFLIYAFDQALHAKRYVQLWDAKDFRELLETGEYRSVLRAGDVALVDDVHEYLDLCEPGASGPFVSFFEHCRLGNISLVMTLAREWEQLPCDDHIQSRLKLCQISRLNNPDEPSLSAIIRHLGKQRGMQLSERKLSYLEKRLGRSIEEIEECLDRVVNLSIAQGRAVDFALLQDAIP